MAKLLINGSKIEFSPNAGWSWYGWDGVVTLKISDSQFSVSGKPVATEKDIPRLNSELENKKYTALPFICPGSLSPQEIIVLPNSLAQHSSIEGVIVVTEDTHGIFLMSVSSPAKTPKGDPDIVPIKTGTWKIKSAGQCIADTT